VAAADEYESRIGRGRRHDCFLTVADLIEAHHQTLSCSSIAFALRVGIDAGNRDTGSWLQASTMT
jgi:hypothetical protein